jgi:hypothetical protein
MMPSQWHDWHDFYMPLWRAAPDSQPTLSVSVVRVFGKEAGYAPAFFMSCYVADILDMFQCLPCYPGASARHDATYMTGKIDLALVKLAREKPRECFHQKGDPGYVIQWTSTCTDMPARWPVHTETQWTPMLYASIATEYERLQTHRSYSYTQRLYYAGEPFGRGGTTVKTALKAFSLFPKSS